MRRLQFIIAALLAQGWTAPVSAQAPPGTVRGRVSDAATRQPLAGVTLSIGSRGALTQADGRYVITGVPIGTDTLRARLIGYARAAQAVAVAGGDTIAVDLALTGQAVNLSEVVVTGYGTQQAGNITGAVKQVTATEFNTGRIITPQALIQGKVAGVQVVDNNEPGGGLSIRIRGATSVNASSDPLYVVDGMPVTSVLSAGRDPLNVLNPADIESITVLKDASAAAIYGANAANGVVLITTRKSRQHGPEIEYTTSMSSSSVTRVPSVLDASQFRAAVAAQAPARSASLGNANTNWFDLIDRSAFGQQHDVVVSGVGQSSNYRFSVGYLNQDGIIRTSSTERLSLGVTYEQLLLNDNLDIKTNVRGARTSDDFQARDVLGNAVAMAPTQPVYDPTNATGYWDWPTTGASASNPVASLNRSVSQGSTWRSIGNLQGAYHLPFLRSLTANLNLGYDLTQANNQTFIPNDLAAQIRQGQGFLSLSNRNQSSLVSEWYLNYSAPITAVPGNIDLTAGYSYTRSHSESPYFQETGLPTNLLGINGVVVDSTSVVQNSNYVVDYKLISFFGRFNYNLNDRYLLAGSLRRDGSSRFGPGHEWGTFPSVSVAWRISQEPFLRNITALADLKIRASWARTGNQAFGDYLQYPTYTFSNAQAQYYFGGQFVPTIRPGAVDPNIHWESTKSYNVGMDYALFGQRISGAIDWYTKNTSDLIFTVPVAAGTNFTNLVTTNVGTMRNRGIEFSLSARFLEARAEGWGWTADFTVSHNGNELLSINPNKSVSQINIGGIGGGTGNTIQVLKPGFPINSFFVCQQFYQNGKPVENTYVPLVQNAARDSTVQGCTNDLRPFHSPWPTVELGHTSYVTFRNFDLSFTLRAQLGNYVYNNVAAANGSYQNITSGNVTPTNMDASVLKTNFTAPRFLSDYYVQRASFLRMDNITLGYAFQYGGRPWRAYGTIQNAFTITGYDGVDPTAAIYGANGTTGTNGIDNNIYPRSRTFSGGLSVRF
ncbi:MAG TPA: SusC/RagA family TonB-linked outer membrane protein [Gemmatimonadales bacterium]|nr:SusC/RagA family TonB-linked outer membrane protein [Gemmatimonadales bacterium]